MEDNQANQAIKNISTVFILGSFWESLATGVYVAAIALFISYLSPFQNLLLIGLATAFACEAFAEIIAGWAADRLGKRFVVLVGMGCLAFAFFSFGSTLFFISENTSTAFSALLGMFFLSEIALKSGNACISGAFESWAIEQIKHLNPSFESDELFARQGFWERTGLLAGVAIFSVLYFGLLWLLPKYTIAIWLLCWSVPFTVMVLLTNWMRKSMKEEVKRPAQSTGAKDTGSSTFELFYKTIKNKYFITTTLVFVGWYVTGILLLYIWPKFFVLSQKIIKGGGVEYFKPFFIPSSLVVAILGGLFAINISKKIKDLGKESKLLLMSQRLFFILLGSVLDIGLFAGAIALFLFASLQGIGWLVFVAFAMLITSRFSSRIAIPFILSALHASIEDEEVRATAASVRTAFGNLVAFFIFILIEWNIGGTLKSQSKNNVLLGYFLFIAAVTLLMTIVVCFIFWRHSSQEEVPNNNHDQHKDDELEESAPDPLNFGTSISILEEQNVLET